MIISDGWGGAETVVYELAKHFLKKGNRVSIILNEEILEFYQNLDGVQILNIGSVYNYKYLTKDIRNLDIKNTEIVNKNFFLFLYIEFLRPIFFKKIKRKISQFVSVNEIDILHSHLENSHILASCLDNTKVRWIGTVHGPNELTNRKYNNPVEFICRCWKESKVKLAFYKMNKITFVSYWLLDHYNSLIPIREKSVVLYNGINLSEFQENLGDKLELKGNFNLIFPGGSKSIKSPEIMIESLYIVKNEIPNVHLYIAGIVPQNNYIRAMVKNLGLEENVSFTGYLPPQKYRNLLKQVDLLVMTSKAEAFPIALLEAMGMGKSVIATNVGGIPEIVENKQNGVLVEHDPSKVTDAILYLYRNTNERKTIENKNLEHIKKFDWDPIIDKYLSEYKK